MDIGSFTDCCQINYATLCLATRPDKLTNMAAANVKLLDIAPFFVEFLAQTFVFAIKTKGKVVSARTVGPV